MAKCTSHYFPWPALYLLYCCDSLWQGASAITASILCYIMNENHEINVVPMPLQEEISIQL